MRADLKADILSLLPALRAFAFCLTLDRSQADELVHASLVDIWSRHAGKKGLPFEAAAFQVVRGRFLRHGVVADLLAASCFGRMRLAVAGNAFACRFSRLPRPEREAVSLVGLWGFDVEQAAAICGCNRATMKRRLASACRCLAPTLCPPTPGSIGIHDLSAARALTACGFGCEVETRPN